MMRMLDSIQLMIDVLEQGTKRAFTIGRITLPPGMFVAYYNGVLAQRHIPPSSAVFAGIPVRCGEVPDITLEIVLRPDAFKQEQTDRGVH